ncbi:MAG: hypothetical protein V7638_25 [Acidobacteriota bacterium]|jgi:hypothetical protein
MPESIPCASCRNEIPQSALYCPHCGQRAIFWNVLDADQPDERAALQIRYDAAKADALARGADAAVTNFEIAVADSKAILSRSVEEVQRLANSTRELYATYYELIEAHLKLPDNDKWNRARELTDTALFPHYKEHIRFAALSLDGVGLSSFGFCSIELRDDMIGHRASVFNENSVLFMERHGVKVSRKRDLPKGYRAVWGERGKLCTAKLAASIDSTTASNQYSRLLLAQGASPETHKFVEVHIFGPMTVLTMAKIKVTSVKAGPRAKISKALIFKLLNHNVAVEQ